MDLTKYYPDIAAKYPAYVTKRELCEICHICPKTAYNLEQQGEIPYTIEQNHLIRSHKIKLTDILAYLYRRECRQEADSPYICATVTTCNVKGERVTIKKDKAKNKSSLRTYPLIPFLKERLLEAKKQQEENRKLCGRAYNKEYLGYVCVDVIGNLIKPNYVSSTFGKLLAKNNLRHIRFHDLRHPYVKPTTKKFASFLKFFRAAAIAARSCSIRYSWLMLPFQISPFLKSPA